MHDFLALGANKVYLLCILETPRQSPALRVKSSLCIRHGVDLHLHGSLRVERRIVVLVLFTMMELEHKSTNAAGKNLSHPCATLLEQSFPHSLRCICHDSGILLPGHTRRTNGSRSASYANQDQREETQDSSRPDSSKSTIQHSIHTTIKTTSASATQKVKKETLQIQHSSHAYSPRPPTGTP